MTSVQETIPDGLRADVDAALAWFNEREEAAFEVTGILDPDAALATEGPRELGLVLCGGDRCEQRTFRVAGGEGGRTISLAGDEAPDPAGRAGVPAELDPPPGALRGWLDRARERHAFVVLLFYRGYW